MGADCVGDERLRMGSSRGCTKEKRNANTQTEGLCEEASPLDVLGIRAAERARRRLGITRVGERC